MKTAILECRRDEHLGALGYVVRGMRRLDDFTTLSDGRGLAHDLLEHQSGVEAIGSVGDELVALGAVWWVRGQWGDLSRDGIGSAYSPEESLAADVAHMFEQWDNVGFDAPTPRTRANGAYDAAVEAIIECARKEIRAEHENANYGGRLDAYLDAARHFMRRGVTLVKRRWQNEPHRANAQFWAIAEAARAYLGRPDYEGQLLRLRYGAGEATCEEFYQEDEYEY